MNYLSKVITGTVALLALSACVTTEGYRQQMTQWYGAHVDDLLIHWGQPDSKTELSDGRIVWVYNQTEIRNRGGYVENNYSTYDHVYVDRAGNRRIHRETVNQPVYIPPYSVRSQCNTHFVVSGDSVQDFTFNGEGCVARER